MHTHNQRLQEAKRRQTALIAAHRGVNGGNIIQNTILAYEASLQHGADMIEIDVIMSTDGEFYAFHNGQEKLILRVDQDIRQLSSNEIENLQFYNQIGEKVEQRIEKLEDILPRFKNRCFINIDRAWFYWKEVIQFLVKQDMCDQLILKSAPEDTLLATVEEYGKDIMYMPIIKSIEEWEHVKKFNINIVAAELIFEDLSSPLVSDSFLQSLTEAGILKWVNSITLNDEIKLSANLDDNHAITEGYDAVWGTLMNKGFDIIQTDWPALVKKYIESRAK